MEVQLQEFVARLADSPWLQGIAAALCTFVLEDPTTIGCGLLVADGKMGFKTALAGLTAGIAVGDLGLYLLGRFVGGWLIRRGFLKAERLAGIKAWFDRNLAVAVLSSRFLPGMRFPTYTGAGLLRASIRTFLAVVVVASFVWTLLLLTVVSELGREALPLLGRWKWPAAGALVGTVATAQWWIGRRRAKGLETKDGGRGAAEATSAAGSGVADPGPVVSRFEFWPMWMFYPPVVLHYFLLGLRHRSWTLPTAANPTIFCGGLVGESKSRILELAGDGAREWISPWVAFRRGADSDDRAEELRRAVAAVAEAGFGFPLVAKPDVGERGMGVRKVEDEAALGEYLAAFPPGCEVVLQKLVPFDCEAGIFYVRRPDEERGRIFSLTLKYFPAVVGDGRSTLRELILADPRARVVPGIYFRRHAARLDEVLPDDERFPLVFAGNHAQGAVFKDGRDRVTPELLARIDSVCKAVRGFHYGRLDLRFESMEALARGEGFRIVEINGAGAEATHIWDARTPLREAYATLFEQFRILFEIGAANRALGHRPVGPRVLLRAYRDSRRVVRNYPVSS